jgi:hypothetical protein
LETIYIYPEEIPLCRLCIDSFHITNHKIECKKCDTPKFFKMKFTHVNSLVSLKSFYDLGRLPFHLGGSYGRVMWTALDGSKWLDFKTWGSFRLDVFVRDNGTCKMCGKVIAEKDEHGYYPYQPPFVCDHIIPLFKDGKDWWEDPEMTNFQTLCEECNKIKTKHDVSKPKVIKQKLGLKTIQYAGFVFEQREPVNHSLDQFILSDVKCEEKP